MRKWTPEERQRQAEAIRKWKPWRHSTGPKTLAGKRKSRMNACKPVSLSREIAVFLRMQHRLLKRVAKNPRLYGDIQASIVGVAGVLGPAALVSPGKKPVAPPGFSGV